MLKCRDVGQLLYEYVEKLLEPSLQQALEAHLADCAGCLAFINTYKQTIRLSAGLQPTEMPPELQVKLMRALQERTIRHLGDTREYPIDVRVIAATNKPVQESLESGAVRKDLYYRLSVITIHLPALRERAEDVPLLVEHFLRKHEKNYNKRVDGIEQAARDALIRYAWPGNVRELENLIEMLLAFGKSPLIRLSDLPERILDSPHKKSALLGDEVYTLKEAERHLVINALAKSKGNKSLAAQMLGISRKSLYKKLGDYRIDN